MPIIHEDYSGFFPFWLYDYQLEKDTDLTTGGVLFDLPLPLLTRLYWLAKSIDITLDLAYTLSDTEGESRTGTVTGTVTLGPGTDDIENRILSNTPAQRVICRVQQDFLGTVAAGQEDGTGSFTDAGTLTAPDGSTIPYSNDAQAFIVWFAGMKANPPPPCDNGNNGSVAYDQDTNKYYTRFFAQLPCAGTIITTDSTTPEVYISSMDLVSSSLLHLQVEGHDIVAPTLFPFYFANPGNETMTVTGTAVINFNEFWTP